MVKQIINNIHDINIKKNINLELNGLRGAACLLIFVFHCRILSGSPDIRTDLGLLYLLPEYGAYAVDFFFVLSGFFAILPYVKTEGSPVRKISLSAYYKKKIIRIFPPYYLNLIVMFGMVVPFVLGFNYLFSKNGILTLLAHLSFLQYLHPATSASLGINGALWFLSVLFQFFLIFPLIKNLFIDGKENFYLFIFIFLSVLWKYLSWYDMDALVGMCMDAVSRYGVDEFTIRFFLSNQMPAQLSHLAIGMVLGNIYIKNKSNPGKDTMIVVLSVLSGFLLTLYSFRVANLAVPPWWYLWRLWLAIGSGCLIYLTAINGPAIFKAVFQSKYFGFLGTVSYEIYLWHLLILYILNKTVISVYIQGVNLFWVYVFLGGGITLLISYASMKLISFARISK